MAGYRDATLAGGTFQGAGYCYFRGAAFVLGVWSRKWKDAWRLSIPFAKPCWCT